MKVNKLWVKLKLDSYYGIHWGHHYYHWTICKYYGNVSLQEKIEKGEEKIERSCIMLPLYCHMGLGDFRIGQKYHTLQSQMTILN